ncbi:MAG: type II toxin-antitoxin system death-on-curing family toxin [Hyphomicrobiaceae bacterium]|nr:MAG: type II toxin-antitoxin system death-on-curing family toxin [Hyphomicrobiaceae bacterium]
MTRVYLTVAEVLAIHKDQIERFVGSPGVRDPGQLEAALFRPQTGYYEDVIGEAAAVWESLSQNHPFVDGNKRTAFAVMVTFLAVNGVMPTAPEEAVMKFLLPLYERGTLTFDRLDVWLRTNARD